MNLVEQQIVTEIKNGGAISFARFMEISLYAPEIGYYECENVTGKQGDFYTSVSVGSLFGELLAMQFVEWLEEISVVEKIQIIETGAHGGQLVADILTGLESRPDILQRLEYWIIEPSQKRQGWQRQDLALWQKQVRWFDTLDQISINSVSGIIFSNELFDAMPVHRLGWNAKSKTWFEWHVSWNGNAFDWQKLPAEKSILQFLPELPAELLDVLPDGFTTEVSLSATKYWRESAQRLKQGKLMAIDYGLVEEEFFLPHRSNGTLRAYSKHHTNADLLDRAGEQDITAHVNFTALRKAGETTGLKTELFIPQSKFFTQIVEQLFHSDCAFDWNPSRLKQFQTLVHPEHLGRSFKVLMQSI